MIPSSSLAALRTALEQATQGEWRTQPTSSGGLLLLRGDDSASVRTRHLQSHLHVYPEADAEFIALAKNAMPQLLADAETLAAAQHGGRDFAEGKISAGKLAELLGVEDKHGFKQRAHASCDRDTETLAKLREMQERIEAARVDQDSESAAYAVLSDVLALLGPPPETPGRETETE